LPKQKIAKKVEFPVELTLKFKSKEDRANWIGWYLDGGGEQDCHYYTQTGESNWTGAKQHLTLKADEDQQCPVCLYVGDYTEGDCGNCGYKS
jgi:hypothetical protein